MSQQIGAALGLAVLVTIFDALTGHVQLGPGSSAHAATVVHAIDAVFAFGALFALAALVTILVGIKRDRTEGAALTAPFEYDSDVLEPLQGVAAIGRGTSSPAPDYVEAELDGTRV